MKNTTKNITWSALGTTMLTRGFPHKRTAVPKAFLYHDCYYVGWMRGCHFLDLPLLTPIHSTRRRWVNILGPRQNGRHFADDIYIFFYKIVIISINISLNFVPKCSISNISALVQVMAWLDEATSHYLNQWLIVYWCTSASVGLNELNETQLGYDK